MRLLAISDSNWSPRQGLNLRQPVYKTGALPLSYEGVKIVASRQPWRTTSHMLSFSSLQTIPHLHAKATIQGGLRAPEDLALTRAR
jgi:hypothetical protein